MIQSFLTKFLKSLFLCQSYSLPIGVIYVRRESNNYIGKRNMYLNGKCFSTQVI